MEHNKPTPMLVRSSELVTIVPFSLNHIRRLENAGHFPKRIRVGANRVGWIRGEVEQWINDRMGAR
jgi:prophage regulatory protein